LPSAASDYPAAILAVKLDGHKESHFRRLRSRSGYAPETRPGCNDANGQIEIRDFIEHGYFDRLTE
jgi:hypothetical protein